MDVRREISVGGSSEEVAERDCRPGRVTVFEGLALDVIDTEDLKFGFMKD